MPLAKLQLIGWSGTGRTKYLRFTITMWHNGGIHTGLIAVPIRESACSMTFLRQEIARGR